MKLEIEWLNYDPDQKCDVWKLTNEFTAIWRKDFLDRYYKLGLNSPQKLFNICEQPKACIKLTNINFERVYYFCHQCFIKKIEGCPSHLQYW